MTFAQWWRIFSIGTGATHDAQSKRIARLEWNKLFKRGNAND